MTIFDNSKEDYPSSLHTDPKSKVFQKLLTDWLARAQIAFDTGDVDLLVDLFDDEGYWRDILILDFDFNSLKKDKIKSYIKLLQLKLPSLQNLSLDRPEEIQTVQILPDVEVLQGFIKFETDVYRGSGMIRLKLPSASNACQDDDHLKAFTFFTQLWEVKGHEEKIKSRRPIGATHSYEKTSQNWLEMRSEETESFGLSAQPTVMIIGAGQSGLMLAARLKLLGLSTLIVDKNQRTGDSWRKRYHSLCLHDPIWADHFPYMSYPDNWPIYIPKDKLAGWFEYYAEAMELSIWNEATVQPGSSSYDPTTGAWSVEVIRPTGPRTLHPRFLVMATGLNGAPRWPDNFPMDAFTGTLVHSSAFNTGEAWKAKHAVVIGACNSAHDIAADLWVNGATSVTMVQRSSTYVMSSEHGLKGLMKGSYEEDGPVIQDADLAFTSLPLNILEKIHTKATEETTRLDHLLLESLEKVGFKLDPHPAGLLMKFFRKGGGYYIDVGCSALLADRKIKLKQGVEVEELTPHGVKFEDGEEIEADLVVCATGYTSFLDTIRSILGPHVSEKLGPIWGADSQGEVPGVWRLSGHPAFWVMCGNLTLARCFSKHVATQILLQELGLCDKNFPGRLGKSYFKEVSL